MQNIKIVETSNNAIDISSNNKIKSIIDGYDDYDCGNIKCRKYDKARRICYACIHPEIRPYIYRDLSTNKIKCNMKKSYFFKYIPSFDLVSEILLKVCDVDNSGYYIHNITFKKLKYFNNNMILAEQLEFYYHRKYKRYLDNMNTYNGFLKVITQLCNLYDIEISIRKTKVCGLKAKYNHIHLQEKLQIYIDDN